MSTPKASRRPPGGSRKGRPNKATADMRTAIQHFIEANIPRVQELFDRVARKNPAKAIELMTSLADFCLPRLARTEIQATVAQIPPGTVVTDANEAARVYQQLLGDLSIDVTNVRFAALPAPAPRTEAAERPAIEVEAEPRPALPVAAEVVEEPEAVLRGFAEKDERAAQWKKLGK